MEAISSADFPPSNQPGLLSHFQSHVLDGLSQLVVLLDPHGHIIWANKAACRKAGLVVDALISNPCHRVWNCRGEACAKCPLGEAVAAGVQTRGRLDLGQSGAWETTITPFFNQQGLIMGFAEVAQRQGPPLMEKFTHDLSFRALRCLCQSAQSIIACENENAMLNESCRIVVEVGGYHGAIIVYANHDPQRSVSLMAYHGLEFLETSAFVKTLSWNDADPDSSVTIRAINTGSYQIVYDATTDPTYRVQHENLGRMGLRSCIGLPLRDDAGQVIGALTVLAREPNSFSGEEAAILQNMADNLSYGVRILRSRREKAVLLSAMGQIAEGLVFLDQDGVIGYVNQAAERISMFSKEELVGCHFSILQPHATGQKLPPSLREALKSGRPWSGRLASRRKNGESYIIEANISPVSDEQGGDKRYFLVVKDATAQVALEARLRQAQKMEAIGTLSRGIAHDFNNILAAIMGFTEASLSRLHDREALRGNLAEVVVACDRAKNLVRQILSFSRPSEKNRTPVDIKAAAEEVLNLLRATLPTTVEILANTEVDCRVMADSTEIHQVLMNICSNAGQAMQNGGVLRLSLSTQKIASTELLEGLNFNNVQPGQFVRIDIADTGHGMTPETLDRIFDPFFTTRQGAGGSGLGLSVVHGIVNSLGGALTIRSKPGLGSTFSVYLPVTNAVGEPREQYQDKAPGGSETILLVDDEPALVDATTMILEDLGYQVVGKTSSESALRDFNASPELFDLVITDQTMPGMTGEELARNFLTQRPDLPVIILSGYNRCVTTPFGPVSKVVLLDKPIRRLDLAKAIRQALDRPPAATDR